MYRPKTKRDKNHVEIVKALKEIGCTVVDLAAVGASCPDILVGVAGKTRKYNLLIEIKNGNATFKPNQREFYQNWKGQTTLVKSVEDAIYIVKYYMNL